jgi:hypothetical protein
MSTRSLYFGAAVAGVLPLVLAIALWPASSPPPLDPSPDAPLDPFLWAAPAPALGADPGLEKSEPPREESQVPVELRKRSVPEESVVINEVNYHAPSGDPREEWIELFNRSTSAVDLSGWRFVEGVEFTFPAGAAIGAGEYLVVAADGDRIRQAFGIENVVGNWKGSLKHGHQKIRLMSGSGREVESFTYSDHDPFPVSADGLGRSLERRDPNSAADEPANWGASRSSGWVRLQARGTASSRRIYLYLQGAGTVFLDDLALRPLEEGGREGVSTGFEEDDIAWTFNGNHGSSRITGERARTGKRSLKIVAQGPGASLANSVSTELTSVRAGGSYLLECWAYFMPPRVPLTIRFSRGRIQNGFPQRGGLVPGGGGGNSLAIEASGGGAGSTPGRRNSLYSPSLPPFIYPVSHSPPKPAPGAEVTISASVFAGREVKEVLLHYDDGRGERTVPLAAQPPAEGGAAGGKRSWSAKLGPFEKGTLVRYRLTAADAVGERGSFPLEENPTRTRGFYVQEAEKRSSLPLYQLFLSPVALRDLNSNPHSDSFQPATFVYDGEVYCDVGVRFRGQTSRFIQKHHWKVKFQKDHRFITPEPDRRQVRSIDLNSSYGDKIFLREILGYQLWRDLGEASSQCRHVRLELNGAPLGLYLHLETPNEDFLERNRLQGWLWKSYSGAQGGLGGFELKAGEPQSGNAALSRFLQNMNSLSGKPLESYIREHMNVDSFINFLVACQLIHSADHVEKNYLVYADKNGRFTFLPWDLDLTHGRNYECQGGGVWNDVIRADMWDPQYRDSQLLFGTRAHPKCDGFVNGVIDAFLGKTTAFRPLYYQRLAEGLAHYYHPEVILPKAERLHGLIQADAQKDRQRWGSYGGDDDFERNYQQFVRWVRKRYDYLSARLKALGYPVGPPLNADFQAVQSSGPAPLQVTFRNLSVGEVQSWLWDFGDGETSTEKEPTHIFRQPKRYDVTLKATGPAGTHTQARRDLIHALKK